MRETLQDIQNKLRGQAYRNEEQVKISLVTRILQSLGWNLWDPNEVRAEFPAVPDEDQSRVDLALFVQPSSPTIFIEVKATGRVPNDLERIERQLRDYNRDHTALFGIITDGRQWRFYYSQTGGAFAQKCFKVIDLLNDDLAASETYLSAFLSKTEVENGSAQRDAETYLQLSRKQRAMEDNLPTARRLVREPPFPSLPDALRQLTARAGFAITVEEAQQFITDARPESQADSAVPPVSTSQTGQRQAMSSQTQTYREEPSYISTFREMLSRPDTLPSRMLAYISQVGVVTWGDLKRACVEELGYRESGSIGASLKVLEVDGYVTIDGFGNGKRIRRAARRPG